MLELFDSHYNKVRVNFTSIVPAFSITGLEPGQSYVANIYAINNKGRSEPSTLSVFTVRNPEKILTRKSGDYNHEKLCVKC